MYAFYCCTQRPHVSARSKLHTADNTVPCRDPTPFLLLLLYLVVGGPLLLVWMLRQGHCTAAGLNATVKATAGGLNASVKVTAGGGLNAAVKATAAGLDASVKATALLLVGTLPSMSLLLV